MMLQVVQIVAAGFAGVGMGFPFGYVFGHTKGWNQAKRWYESNIGSKK